jgi:hypothetical protein
VLELAARREAIFHWYAKNWLGGRHREASMRALTALPFLAVPFCLATSAFGQSAQPANPQAISQAVHGLPSPRGPTISDAARDTFTPGVAFEVQQYRANNGGLPTPPGKP